MAPSVLSAVALSVAAADFVCEALAPPPRPNIVWVMADDLGWGEPGLFPSTSAHGRISTPNLDEFGRQGLVFTRAYAGYTVCAPSRTAFFTGRHSGQFVKHDLNGESLPVAPHLMTLPQVLQGAGYTTGAFGKTAPLASPQQQGFNVFIGQVDQSHCHNMYPRSIDRGLGQQNLKLTGNVGEKNRFACMAHPERYNYTIDVFHEYGMSWLESVAQGPAPFFLYLSYTVPHAGGWGDAPQDPEEGAPVPTDLQYVGRSWPNVEKDHAAVITYLDDKVGDLMERLKSLGIDNDTLVIFASDNGAHQEGGHSHDFFNSTGGLRGHKRSLFEGGVRSPSMARWPAVIRPNQTSDFAWAFWDALPTLAQLAGAEVPAGLDGISIVPTFLGQAQDPHDFLYFTWLEASMQKAPGYAVNVGRWKGIVPQCSDTIRLQPSLADDMQLYDLVADPFETTDLAAQHGRVVEMMKTLVTSGNLSCLCYQCGFTALAAGVVEHGQSVAVSFGRASCTISFLLWATWSMLRWPP